MADSMETLKQWIEESGNIVFFGGAGVSTESGIPDFRSVDGLYNQEYKYPPETIISHSFYRKNPEEFYRFYKSRMIFSDAKPNAAHIALAKLEQQGKCGFIRGRAGSGHAEQGGDGTSRFHTPELLYQMRPVLFPEGDYGDGRGAAL